MICSCAMTCSNVGQIWPVKSEEKKIILKTLLLLCLLKRIII